MESEGADRSEELEFQRVDQCLPFELNEEDGTTLWPAGRCLDDQTVELGEPGIDPGLLGHLRIHLLNSEEIIESARSYVVEAEGLSELLRIRLESLARELEKSMSYIETARKRNG